MSWGPVTQSESAAMVDGLRPVTSEGFVSLNKLSAGEGRAHRDFARQQGGRSNFGQLESARASGDSHHLQTLATRSQRGAASHCGYCQRRHGHRDVNVATRGEFKISNAGGGVHYIGHILAAGDEESCQSVRIVSVVSRSVRLHVA